MKKADTTSGEHGSRDISKNRVLSFLKNNKIFFDTLAATLLSIMAIIVSFAQVLQGCEQNALVDKQTKLVELQTEIQNSKIQPQLVVTARQVVNKATGNADEDILTVVNKGEILYDFRASVFVFYLIEMQPSLKITKKPTKLLVPINGYYFLQSPTAEGKGKLFTCLEFKNNKRAAEFERKFAAEAKKRDYWGHAEVRRFIKIWYRDLRGEQHIEYYYVPLIYGGTKLDLRRGRQLFKLHQRGYVDGTKLEFGNITPQDVFDLFNDDRKLASLAMPEE